MRQGSGKTFQLARYKKGDEHAILRLFEEVFGSSESLEQWNWHFLRNPYGEPKAVLAWEPNSGKLVGQHTVIPLPLNFLGKRIQAAQCLDTMVHEDVRGQGIFERTGEMCFRNIKEEGYCLVYAFPNRNSYPGYLRKLGWNRITFLTSYIVRLGLPSSLAKRLVLPGLSLLSKVAFAAFNTIRFGWEKTLLRVGLPGHIYRTSESVPPGYEELWNAVRSYEVISIWKDTEYFHWRYDEKPSGSYRYHYLESNHRIRALCVSTVKDGVCHILELITLDQSIRLARYLVLSVLFQAMRGGASRLNFEGTTLNFFDDVFRGFVRLTNFNRVFCLEVLNPPRETVDVTVPGNWTVTLGDSDIL